MEDADVGWIGIAAAAIAAAISLKTVCIRPVIISLSVNLWCLCKRVADESMPGARPPAASHFSLRQRVTLAAQQNQYRDSQNQYGQRAAGLDHMRNQQAIFSRGGIVVIAEQQDLIRGRADFSFRRFHKSQSQIARRVLNAIEVARN